MEPPLVFPGAEAATVSELETRYYFRLCRKHIMSETASRHARRRNTCGSYLFPIFVAVLFGLLGWGEAEDGGRRSDEHRLAH